MEERLCLASSVSEDVVDMVATLDGKGSVTAFKFPIAWSKSHYNRKLATYAVKNERLDANDQETLRLLQNMVTHLPTRPSMINVWPIIKVKSHKALRAVLGRYSPLSVFKICFMVNFRNVF